MPNRMVQAQDIGGPPSLSDLAAARDIALFLDFDGTLVEIADTPDSIIVPDHLGERLVRLADRFKGRLALITGRSLDDIANYIDPLAIACAGSHGIDRRLADGLPLGPPADPLPEKVLSEIERFAAKHDDLRLESKSHGAALHFRNAPGLERPVADFALKIAGDFGLKSKSGKFVVELVRPAADKAEAVRVFMEEEDFLGSMPLFIGDDLTDEDGFRAVNELGGFGIIVGQREDTAARFRLSSPEKVYEWLEL